MDTEYKQGFRDGVASVGWRPIPDDAKSGDDVLLYFPLEGLGETNPRRVIGYWKVKPSGGGEWVFQNRAYRGYSEIYQPTHWMPLPEEPKA